MPWLGSTDSKLPVVSVAFLVWSALAPFWVRAPVRWIYREFDQNSPDRTRDFHLVTFELTVSWCCVASSICGLVVGVLDHSHVAGGIAAVSFNLIVLARSYGVRWLDRPELRWI
jgi:hypothetical protein